MRRGGRCRCLPARPLLNCRDAFRPQSSRCLFHCPKLSGRLSPAKRNDVAMNFVFLIEPPMTRLIAALARCSCRRVECQTVHMSDTPERDAHFCFRTRTIFLLWSYLRHFSTFGVTFVASCISRFLSYMRHTKSCVACRSYLLVSCTGSTPENMNMTPRNHRLAGVNIHGRV